MLFPHSRQVARFRALDGATEALIAELSVDHPITGGIELLDAMLQMEPAVTTAANLTLTDFEMGLASLYCHVFGEAASSEPFCTHCGEQVELAFSLVDLAASASPRVPKGVTLTSEGGSVNGLEFRLPRARDARAVEGHNNAANLLLATCTEEQPGSAAARRIERAIASVAPLLSRIIAAPCAACGALVQATLHLPSFVVGALAWRARSVFDDVHLIASGYGWRETEILALSSSRRRHYAARLREGR